jgi:hypothetical protein
LLLAGVLAHRLGWHLSWAVRVALGAIPALVVARAALEFEGARRRLAALQIVVDDQAIAAERSGQGAVAVRRAEVARVVEVGGALGGLRVESLTGARGGRAVVVVPRGGEAFGEVRAQLERWGRVERRAAPSRMARLALGGGVVAAVYLLPFVLEDLLSHSQALAAALIALAWTLTRRTLRRR